MTSSSDATSDEDTTEEEVQEEMDTTEASKTLVIVHKETDAEEDSSSTLENTGGKEGNDGGNEDNEHAPALVKTRQEGTELQVSLPLVHAPVDAGGTTSPLNGDTGGGLKEPALVANDEKVTDLDNKPP